jgi:two-component system sensor histidine kinase/response regulator
VTTETPKPDRPVVLVVDDSAEYLNLLGSALAPLYTVKVANSGRRAIALAQQDPRPEVILLDVLMPGMDGHEVLASLRADPKTSDIPAIFVTSLDAASDELTALELGAADFITKPALPQVVRARVQMQVQLKQARDLLRERNQALQAALAELQAFSYTVSHDLRAPLQAIAGFAQALAEAEGPALSERGRHRLDRILQGAQRMDRMIEDILVCSRAERAQLQRHSVDLDALTRDVVEELATQYARTVVDVAPLPRVVGDSVLLRQVMANLVGNALKFSAHADSPNVTIDAATQEGRVQVRVRDNGAGFDAAYAHKLFTLFQRLHTESEFPGSGVGLAIVKRVVARHGGQVAAESVPGGWTTFSFALPAI